MDENKSIRTVELLSYGTIAILFLFVFGFVMFINSQSNIPLYFLIMAIGSAIFSSILNLDVNTRKRLHMIKFIVLKDHRLKCSHPSLHWIVGNKCGWCDKTIEDINNEFNMVKVTNKCQ